MIAAHDAYAALAPRRPGCGLTVALPAKDEAHTIGRALDALLAQREPDGAPLDPDSFELLILANNCADATATIARSIAARTRIALHVVEYAFAPGEAHIGAARRSVMDAAAHRYGEGTGGLIATTDADSIVSPLWIAHTRSELRAVDAVTGRIVLEPQYLAGLGAAGRRMLAIEGMYQFALSELSALIEPLAHDPWPRHWQHFGASLAVRSDVYRAAGGIPAVSVLEDVALYTELRRRNARVRHSLRVRVTTSGRHSARVSGGLATYLGDLHDLAATGRPFLVEHPETTRERLLGGLAVVRPPVAAETALAALRAQIARLRSIAACPTRSSAASGAG